MPYGVYRNRMFGGISLVTQNQYPGIPRAHALPGEELPCAVDQQNPAPCVADLRRIGLLPGRPRMDPVDLSSFQHTGQDYFLECTTRNIPGESSVQIDRNVICWRSFLAAPVA
jgi:hypothetical protein